MEDENYDSDLDIKSINSEDDESEYGVGGYIEDDMVHHEEEPDDITPEPDAIGVDPDKYDIVGDGLDEDVDNDDDDIDDEDELNSTKKVHLFDKEVNMDYIKETHPECLPINMDELKVMLPVIRNENGIIIDDFHTTIPILTKYEKTRVLGQRASMIEHGAKPFIDVPVHIIDSAIIAEMELNEKKIPFIIKRPLPNNGFEYWRLSDLELIL